MVVECLSHDLLVAGMLKAGDVGAEVVFQIWKVKRRDN